MPWRPATKPAYLTRWLRRRITIRKGTYFHGVQKLLRIETTEKLDQLCDQAGPTGLTAWPRGRRRIAVEVLVEEDVILPLGIGLEFLRATSRSELDQRSDSEEKSEDLSLIGLGS